MAKIRRRCKRAVSIPPLYRPVCQTPLDSDRRDRPESVSSSGGDDPPLKRPREAGFIKIGLALALLVVAGLCLVKPIETLAALESHVFELAFFGRRSAEAESKSSVPFRVENVAVNKLPVEEQFSFASANIVQFWFIYPRGIKRSEGLLGTWRHDGALWLIKRSGRFANLLRRGFSDNGSGERTDVESGGLPPL